MRKTGHRNGEKQSFLVAVWGPRGSLSHTSPKPALQTSGTTPRILAVTGETSRSQEKPAVASAERCAWGRPVVWTQKDVCDGV